MQESPKIKKRGLSIGRGAVLFVLGLNSLPVMACSGPISTMRSPYHLRTVEVRNATGREGILKIEPTASQHLGAATTFTGLLRPGELKSLYLYHGLEYDFRILEAPGYELLTHRRARVDRDLGFVFTGSSLDPEIAPAADPGGPEPTFSDSLQTADPFGLRSGDRIQPDTTRGQAVPSSTREAIAREWRERQGKLQTGAVP